jgi:hypothetical protein
MYSIFKTHILCILKFIPFKFNTITINSHTYKAMAKSVRNVKVEDLFYSLEEVAYGKGKHFSQVLPLRYRLTYSVLLSKVSSFQITEQS